MSEINCSNCKICAFKESLCEKEFCEANRSLGSAYDVEEEINRLKKFRWIPVTERLPEKNGNYLITYRLPWKSETGEDRYEVDMDYWQWNTWDDDNDVVAWMPLPDPYEVEE